MTQNQLQTEAEIRRFLLGEMRDQERGDFEASFVADNAFFEQILVIEDELIESYVRETLSPAEKANFERSFLTTERRRSRVVFTRSMLGKLAAQKEITVAKKTETVAGHPSVWDAVAGLFKSPTLVFGAALALLAAAFVGFVLLGNSEPKEIVRQPETEQMTNAASQADSNQLRASNQTNAVNSPPTSNPETAPEPERAKINSGQKKQNSEKPSNGGKEVPDAVNPVLALFAGTLRSEGKTKELNLPKSARSVVLQLNLESLDYKTYRAEIVTADGELVFTSARVKGRNTRINISVPSQKLGRGDYIVKVSGLNPQNETESVADFSFRVVQK